MSRRASMTRHSGGSFGPSSSGSNFSTGGHGRQSQGSFGPSSDFGPPSHHRHPPPPGHHPPPPLRHHHNRFPRPYYQPYYFWPSSAAYSSGPRDGHQMPQREAIAQYDRKTELLNRSKAVYAFLMLALCIVTVWLSFGVYASTVIQIGAHDSRLLSVKPFFVKTMQVTNRYEVDGPRFYEFHQKPALNHESRWTDSQSVTFNNGWKEFFYWLNDGSTVTVDYTLHSRSHQPVFLMILRDDLDDLKDYHDRPDFGPSVRLKDEGQTRYAASTDADYAISIVTYSPTNVSVDLDMHFKTREYSTAEAIQHSKLKTSYDMSLPLLWSRYGLLVGPGSGQSEVETWEIEISYSIRWNTIIFSFGLLTLLYLVMKARIMSSIHEFDGALPAEYAPLAQATQDTQPSAPTLPTSTAAPTVPTSIAEHASEDSRKKHLTEEQTCTVCLDAPKDSFFVPCGHRATCFACGNRIAQSDPSNCPICREPIQDVKRIYDV